MGYSQFDPAVQGRAAWNAGKTVGTKRPLTQKQIWAIRFFLVREGRLGDRALFDLAIDSKLRGCDLVKIRIGDVAAGPEVRHRATVIQQRTGRPVQFELTGDVRASLVAWLERRGGTIDDYAFPSRVDYASHMSTKQYARLVDEWVTAIGLRRADYGTHSLRRTKASMIYKSKAAIRLGRMAAFAQGAALQSVGDWVESGPYPSQCKMRAVSGLEGAQSNLAVSAKHMIISSGLTILVPKRMVL
jgi:integrase